MKRYKLNPVLHGYELLEVGTKGTRPVMGGVTFNKEADAHRAIDILQLFDGDLDKFWLAWRLFSK